MKKIFSYILIILLIIILSFLLSRLFKEKKIDTRMQTIKVAEVTHSVFYTPFYVAIENGYFQEENINIELLLVSGSDNVAASVLSKDTNIGLAGPESAVYVYTGNYEDYLQVFSGLTRKDGQFILSRTKDFSWNDLIGKEILIGRSTGMPGLSFYKALENKGLDKNKININTSVEFAELSGSFIGGTGDYVNLFEPLASKLEKEKIGYVVASVGDASNDFPYTAFYARKSFIKDNKDILVGFTKAIKKGMDFVNNNDGDKIAKVIQKQFSDTSIEDLKIMINRYKDANVWLDSPFIEKDFYNNLINLLLENSIIKDQVDYKYLVNNLYE
jgi:NitT/TauT family transport system substrate-binding protein